MVLGSSSSFSNLGTGFGSGSGLGFGGISCTPGFRENNYIVSLHNKARDKAQAAYAAKAAKKALEWISNYEQEKRDKALAKQKLIEKHHETDMKASKELKTVTNFHKSLIKYKMEKSLTEEDFKNIDEFTVLYKELCENRKVSFNNEVYYSTDELSKAFSESKPLSNKNLKTWAPNIYRYLNNTFFDNDIKSINDFIVLVLYGYEFLESGNFELPILYDSLFNFKPKDTLVTKHDLEAFNKMKEVFSSISSRKEYNKIYKLIDNNTYTCYERIQKLFDRYSYFGAPAGFESYNSYERIKYENPNKKLLLDVISDIINLLPNEFETELRSYIKSVTPRNFKSNIFLFKLYNNDFSLILLNALPDVYRLAIKWVAYLYNNFPIYEIEGKFLKNPRPNDKNYSYLNNYNERFKKILNTMYKNYNQFLLPSKLSNDLYHTSLDNVEEPISKNEIINPYTMDLMNNIVFMRLEFVSNKQAKDLAYNSVQDSEFKLQYANPYNIANEADTPSNDEIFNSVKNIKDVTCYNNQFDSLTNELLDELSKMLCKKKYNMSQELTSDNFKNHLNFIALQIEFNNQIKGFKPMSIIKIATKEATFEIGFSADELIDLTDLVIIKNNGSMSKANISAKYNKNLKSVLTKFINHELLSESYDKFNILLHGNRISIEFN